MLYLESFTMKNTALLAVLLAMVVAALAQPLPPHLAGGSNAGTLNTSLHNYTFRGATLVTICPCRDAWSYVARNGSALSLSGCAAPDEGEQQQDGAASPLQLPFCIAGTRTKGNMK